jgi:hypothetical protein
MPGTAQCGNGRRTSLTSGRDPTRPDRNAPPHQEEPLQPLPTQRLKEPSCSSSPPDKSSGLNDVALAFAKAIRFFPPMTSSTSLQLYGACLAATGCCPNLPPVSFWQTSSVGRTELVYPCCTDLAARHAPTRISRDIVDDRLMLCKETNHLWLGRFSVRLMQLRRDISWPRAVTRAVVAHAYLSDLSPEKAALLESTAPMWKPTSRLSGMTARRRSPLGV